MRRDLRHQNAQKADYRPRSQEKVRTGDGKASDPRRNNRGPGTPVWGPGTVAGRRSSAFQSPVPLSFTKTPLFVYEKGVKGDSYTKMPLFVYERSEKGRSYTKTPLFVYEKGKPREE